jgi:hypothetical protein
MHGPAARGIRVEGLVDYQYLRESNVWESLQIIEYQDVLNQVMFYARLSPHTFTFTESSKGSTGSILAGRLCPAYVDLFTTCLLSVTGIKKSRLNLPTKLTESHTLKAVAT